MLVSFRVEPSGNLNIAAPLTAVTERVRVSDSWFSGVIACVVVLIAYVLAVLALGRAGRKRWDPIVLTAGHKGKASLSKLQIFGFTALVIYLLSFVLLRTGVLIDISQDVLLLLGISAAGAGGGKLAAVAKNRLTFENWAWLCNRSWLKDCEKGVAPKDARWADLLKSGQEFDVYKFQLAVVSFVVAGALLTGDLSTLASFEIPQNLLGLLGLSNVVYIGGKAVAPGVSELNVKIQAVRNAEMDWVKAAKAAKLTTLAAAISGQPEKYETYIAAARDAAFMLRSIYGYDETKFQTVAISDDDLAPSFP
ncbi:MAG: hypothetical protein JSW46_05870 [Gemmatimonadota bacterium]|nr:MAG: hypothetical protein JSW46_05870 [Gemmatimonadota bacterium]